MNSAEQPAIVITLLKLWETPRFMRLRKGIESEAKHLIAKPGERKETIAHIITKAVIMRNRMHTLIAKDGDAFVGYITILFPKFARLKGNAYIVMSVKDSYRGKGIGSSLLKAAEEFARRHGVRRMELEVFGENTRAIHLYERFGYVVEGKKKGAVKAMDGRFDDIIFMAKFL